MKTYWSDERGGCWTQIEFKEREIHIFLGRNHAAGVLVGAIAFAMVFALIGEVWLQLPGTYWLVAAMLFPLFYLRLRNTSKKQTAHLPLLLAEIEGLPADGFARVISFADVAAVVVKENVKRDEVEDDALAQVYLEVVADDFALLIHQEHLHKSDQVIELGQRVAQHIGAEFRDRLDVQ